MLKKILRIIGVILLIPVFLGGLALMEQLNSAHSFPRDAVETQYEIEVIMVTDQFETPAGNIYAQAQNVQNNQRVIVRVRRECSDKLPIGTRATAIVEVLNASHLSVAARPDEPDLAATLKCAQLNYAAIDVLD